MGFTPLAGPGFDFKKHIETLKTKRETINAFSHCTASILAKFIDKTMALHWGNYLDNMLGFDTDLSIEICQQQWKERDNPDTLTRQLILLTEEREAYARQLDQSVKAMAQIMKQQTGDDASPELLQVMGGPIRHMLDQLDAKITYVESQLKALERPQPADGA